MENIGESFARFGCVSRVLWHHFHYVCGVGLFDVWLATREFSYVYESNVCVLQHAARRLSVRCDGARGQQVLRAALFHHFYAVGDVYSRQRVSRHCARRVRHCANEVRQSTDVGCGVASLGQQTIWQSNHASHTFLFVYAKNNFVSNKKL